MVVSKLDQVNFYTFLFANINFQFPTRITLASRTLYPVNANPAETRKMSHGKNEKID